MGELPTQFMSAEPANAGHESEKDLDLQLVQARMAVQTIERFRELSGQLVFVENADEFEKASNALDTLAKEQYGKAWELLTKGADVECFPMMVGGKTGSELEAELKANSIGRLGSAESLLYHPDFEANRQKNPIALILVQFSISEIKGSNEITAEQIYAKGADLGLERCPPEVGPLLCLRGNPKEKTVNIGMKPINYTDSNQAEIFYIDVHGNLRAETIDDYYISSVSSVDNDEDWVFVLPLDRLAKQ